MKIDRLVKWAKRVLPRLQNEPASVVADQLGEEVLRIDDHLGVEVGEPEVESREVILTAFSEPSLFPLVRELATSLAGIPGWRFVALKPPRGFEFSLSIGKTRLEALSLAFAPIEAIEGGVQLILPSRLMNVLPEGRQAEELAWLIVETGIGEELASWLQHLEFADAATESGFGQPVADLAEYVRGHDARLTKPEKRFD